MKKTIRPCTSEPSGKYMEHEQVKEVLARNGSGALFSAFGMAIPEGDHAVSGSAEYLFPG